MNAAIKNEFHMKGIKQWQIAEAIGIHERTLITWLRTELTPERKNKILDAIERINKGGLEDA